MSSLFGIGYPYLTSISKLEILAFWLSIDPAASFHLADIKPALHLGSFNINSRNLFFSSNVGLREKFYKDEPSQLGIRS